MLKFLSLKQQRISTMPLISEATLLGRNCLILQPVLKFVQGVWNCTAMHLMIGL
jgi:hypothetical protein